MDEKIRLAYIGDSPFIFSGFGVVADAILSRLPRDEFEIHGLGTMYSHYPKDLRYFTYYEPCCIHDIMGMRQAIDFIQHVDPDILFFIGDPGTLRNRFQALMLTGRVGITPAVTYFPIEGIPISPHFTEQAIMVHGPVTYTKWGQAELAKLGVEVDYAYHGSDHGNFKKYGPNMRNAVRKAIGWDDKFVIGMVGVNKRSNRYPALLEAAKILKERGRKDFVIYLHTQEQGEAFMGGWELGWQISAYGVEDVSQLKPNQQENKYIARPREGALDYVLNSPDPKDKEERVRNLAILDFISIINCFDVYVDPASAHGWNLPATECAMCGVPIITVNDGFARTEIFSGAAYMMEPIINDHWHTGALLPLVSPQEIADAIEKMWDNKTIRDTYAALAMNKFGEYKWQDTANKFVEKFRAAHQFGLEMMQKNSK